MLITEPTTMVTDYILAVGCAHFAYRLWRMPSRCTGLWASAFSATALAALLGGTFHGFRLPLASYGSVVWSTTLVCIFASALLLIAASIRSAKQPETTHLRAKHDGFRWLRRAVAITLMGVAVLLVPVSLHEHFNQNDLYHVVQLAGLYALFRAAQLLHGSPEGARSELGS